MQSVLHRFNSSPDRLQELSPGDCGDLGLSGRAEWVRGDAAPAAAAEILTQSGASPVAALAMRPPALRRAYRLATFTSVCFQLAPP
jgi:hypothetical protein